MSDTESSQCDKKGATSCENGCPKCSLIKWYPPLLVLSTGLAGLFCWMYVSKPVFIAPSYQETPMLQVDPSLRVPSPDGRSEIEVTPTVQVDRMIDPAMGGLPGEVETVVVEGPGGHDESLLTFSGSSSGLPDFDSDGEFIPLVVPRSEEDGVAGQGAIVLEKGPASATELSTTDSWNEDDVLLQGYVVSKTGVLEEGIGVVSDSMREEQDSRPTYHFAPSFMSDFGSPREVASAAETGNY